MEAILQDLQVVVGVLAKQLEVIGDELVHIVGKALMLGDELVQGRGLVALFLGHCEVEGGADGAVVAQASGLVGVVEGGGGGSGIKDGKRVQVAIDTVQSAETAHSISIEGDMGRIWLGNFDSHGQELVEVLGLRLVPVDGAVVGGRETRLANSDIVEVACNEPSGRGKQRSSDLVQHSTATLGAETRINVD